MGGGCSLLSPPPLHFNSMTKQPRWQDLPEDCWALVFFLLIKKKTVQDRPERHLESVSLVCKQFLTISNGLRSSLSIIDPSKSKPRWTKPPRWTNSRYQNTTHSTLLRRFPNLNRIDLVQFYGDLDFILTEIAQSGLNHLQSLNISEQKIFPEKGLKELGGGGSNNIKNSLKILICARLDSGLMDKHLMVIADAFPYLEELDISDPYYSQHISDAEIVNLSSKLPYLRKLNISGIRGLLFDSTLLRAISSNCLFLTHISADTLSSINDIIIPSIISRRHLISLNITNGIYCYSPPPPPPKTIESSSSSSQLLVSSSSSSSSSRDLRVLEFSHMIISDEFLFIVSEAAFPLKKLALSRCQGFTINGIDSILCACAAYRSLKHLDLRGTVFLTDQSISDLSGYMHELNFIGLDRCSHLTNSTFFTLARNCPSLQEIRMVGTSLGKDGCLIPTEEEFLFLGKQQKNLAIRVLEFAMNSHLNDKTLEKIGFVCPKLESLDVSVCCKITEHGIHEIGKTCSEIRELKIPCDFLVTHNSSEFSKLEVLVATRITDAGLSKVGRNCIGLQRLVFNSCCEVTEKGVIKVVNKCKRLRELSLRNCSCIISDARLSLIVFSRPSLRRIIPPGQYISEEQRDSFLRHGCMVCDTYVTPQIEVIYRERSSAMAARKRVLNHLGSSS